MAEPIYLDYAATTPMDPRVRDRMLAALGRDSGFGNPASVTHAFGRAAAREVEQAAAEVAALLHADPAYLVWTSGATESDNLAVIGGALLRRQRGRHVVTVSTEHKAVLGACAELERRGFAVTYLQPDRDGIVVPQAVAAALQPDTVLVSVMHANNETGVVQDIAAIGEVCRKADVLFHVDAVQSAGKLPLDIAAQCIDLLTVNAHKACGPKGIGALIMNPATVRRVEPLLWGGGQQRGIRAGTLPVHQIAGMGETFRLLAQEMSAEVPRVRQLRDTLWDGIRDLPGVMLNGHPERRISSILTISVAGVEGESLRYAVNDLAVTSGSACNSANGAPSYVLRALGRSDAMAEASLRISLGRFSTAAEVAQAIASLRAGIQHLRTLAPEAPAA